MTRNRLAVYLDGVRVGTLEQAPGGRVSFEYLQEYRDRRGAIPLSLSMPLTASLHRPRAVNAFLAGLLPDSPAALERWAKLYKVSAHNPFALLRYVGRDAAGAVQVLPEDAESDDAANRQGDIEWLTDDQVQATLAGVAHHPTDWNPGRDTGRWSLAGAQGKIALFRSESGRWGIPKDSTPTTHILKPSMPNYEGHHLNEHVCLRAAQILGLPAATTEIMANDDTEVLISHRYDRTRRDGRWVRLHQEDLCQSMSIHPSKKYQSDGGPGVSEIADLFRSLRSRDRADSARRFFDYLVYNVCICAPDAHAKNYSILLGGASSRLAPLYDVASILPYDQEPGVKSAMKIGSAWEMTRVTPHDWRSVAMKLGLNPHEAIDRAEALRLAVPAALEEAASESAIPLTLRVQAERIASLITAYSQRRFDQWGRVQISNR